MIEKLRGKSEKGIYKIYTLAMWLIILFQIGFLIWKTSWVSGISLGFNIGLWGGFSLRRLIK